MKLSVPHIDKSDISSINDVLKSEWISTSSKTVNMFEDAPFFNCVCSFSKTYSCRAHELTISPTPAMSK